MYAARELQRAARRFRKRDGKALRIEIAGHEARRRGVGDVPGQYRLAIREPAHLLLQHVQKRIVETHLNCPEAKGRLPGQFLPLMLKSNLRPTKKFERCAKSRDGGAKLRFVTWGSPGKLCLSVSRGLRFCRARPALFSLTATIAKGCPRSLASVFAVIVEIRFAASCSSLGVINGSYPTGPLRLASAHKRAVRVLPRHGERLAACVSCVVGYVASCARSRNAEWPCRPNAEEPMWNSWGTTT